MGCCASDDDDDEIKLNPYLYSSKELWLTEAVAANESAGSLVVSKVLSLNLNFSFLNWISLLLVSKSHPIVLTRLGGPCSRPYTYRKISMVYLGIKPRTSWMTVRCANHYTKEWSCYRSNNHKENLKLYFLQ